MGTDERALIRKAQNGDSAAFEQLVHSYDRRVFAIAMRFFKNPVVAQDIYQEVFLRVHKNLKSFRFQSQFSTWIYRVTTNVCLSHKRSEKRRKQVSLDSEIGDFSGQEKNLSALPDPLISRPESLDQTLGIEIAEAIQEAMETLSPQQRMVFVLRHFEGHKLREIAEILSCAEGTVKNHLFTAVRRLRGQLEGFYRPREAK